MTPDQFIEAWGDDPQHLRSFPLRLLTQFPLRFEDTAFLTSAGLPSGAAPSLSFGPNYAEAGPCPGNGSNGIQIGSNGSGDPIVLMPDGQVNYLNHDKGFASHYINRDIPTLAEALLRYRQLIADTVAIAGPDGFLDGLVPSHLRQVWLKFLQSADPRAMARGSMWAEEIAMWSPSND